MKYFIGFFITAFILFVATYFLLKVWDIDLISPDNFHKSMVSIAIIIATSFILLIVVLIPFFMQKNTANYDSNQTGIAQKKQS